MLNQARYYDVKHLHPPHEATRYPTGSQHEAGEELHPIRDGAHEDDLHASETHQYALSVSEAAARPNTRVGCGLRHCWSPGHAPRRAPGDVR